MPQGAPVSLYTFPSETAHRIITGSCGPVVATVPPGSAIGSGRFINNYIAMKVAGAMSS
jgi:hypothetical protein